MHLTYRPASLLDVSLCAEMLPEGFCADAGLFRYMLAVWKMWVQEERMAIMILEDGDQNDNPIVAFGCSVFVTDEYDLEAASCAEPPIALDLARRAMDRKSPPLDYEAISKANMADGLNLLVPIIGWSRTKLSAHHVPFVKAKLIEAFRYSFGGYLLKDIMQEVYSEAEMQRGLVIGLALRSDYASFYGRNTELPPEQRHFLLGISRNMVQEGSVISQSFLHTPARFFFKRGEREVLGLALLDRTDEEICHALCISLSTVQKRWRSIYERVTAVAPELFPRLNMPGPNGQRAGSEKKRLMLRYLKHHPEELRPGGPPDSE